MLKSQRIELVLLDAVISHSDSSGRHFDIAGLMQCVSSRVGDCEYREVIAAVQRLFQDNRIALGHYEGLDWIPYDLRDGTDVFYGHTFTYRPTCDSWPYAEELRRGDRVGIFISHISEEQEAASHVQEFLREAFGPAFPIFVSSDYKSIKSGKPWYGEILGGLRKAEVVLVLLTPESIERRWINFESGFGMGQDADVIPVTMGLRKGEIGLPLGQLQARDLNDPKDVEPLLSDVAAICRIPLRDVDVRRFQDGIGRILERLAGRKLELLVRCRSSCLQFAIRNSGSNPIDLIDAEILVPKQIVGVGYSFHDEPPVRLRRQKSIGNVEYEGFCLTTVPSSRVGTQIEPLPSILTKDMGIRELNSIPISLKPGLSPEELGMVVRLRLNGRQGDSGELGVRISDIPPDWPD